ncbi:MAG: GNAT family N-acetyltransferase [Acidimicrobiales bacterium]
MITADCPFCEMAIEAEDLDTFGRVGLAHVRSEHDDVPYPDMSVRNFFEGMVRCTGPTDRLESIGEFEVQPVTEDRLDDWLAFFDNDALADIPQYTACYCFEPHEATPDPDQMAAPTHWTERRQAMIDRLRDGTAFGYLAYVDGRPAGWVNASRRCDYTLHAQGDDDADHDTIGVACFTIAPPYRGHGVSKALLDRVIADAPDRGATAVEAYPFNPDVAEITFRGARSVFDAAGFTEVEIRTRDTVLRRAVD